MLGNGHKLRQRFGLHFLHHIVAMGLHDTCGTAYRPSNLLVGIAANDKLENFPRGQGGLASCKTDNPFEQDIYRCKPLPTKKGD